jgi:hypothetical protein
MTDKSQVSEMAVEPAHRGKDLSSRSILIVLVALWALLTIGMLIFVWKYAFEQKDSAQTLAQQIAFACKSGDFGPGITEANEEAICSNAQKVIKDQTPSQAIQGPPGRDGRDGTDGTDGADGAPGPPGKNGKNGKDGIDGTNGLNGAPGKDGIDGKDGTDGKDGLPGPPGVVQVTTIGCEGPVIHSIAASYDAESQTVTITCN